MFVLAFEFLCSIIRSESVLFEWLRDKAAFW